MGTSGAIGLSDILSQSEIEALLSSLSSDAFTPPEAMETSKEGGAKAVAGKPGRQTSTAYEVYDFRRPDKFSKDQLRTLQMLHETFARLSGTGLSGFLRNSVNIELISLEQVPYEEYLRSINSSVFTILSIPPLNGQAVLEIEFEIIFTMIDKLLGGPGRTVGRSILTDIETPLVKDMIDRLFAGLKSAWEGVVIINPGIEAIETSAQFVQIAPPTDIVISVLFEVRIGETRGAMSLCIPYMVLKPITAKLSAQRWFASGSRRQKPEYKRAIVQQVAASEVECSILLGKSRLQVRDFMRLRVGDVLRLNQRSNQDIQMLVSKMPTYEGRPALNHNKLVFSVTGPYSEI
ncbi:MAG: flagellar motor switch protein FliM [Chthonomonadaceae bacterium]|nr:flagellar motor switch protein FliM [Chthonomonadaceae bacterium]